MMTYAMLLDILKGAQARARNINLPADVRARSEETVALCNERMRNEGLTLSMLKAYAKKDRP